MMTIKFLLLSLMVVFPNFICACADKALMIRECHNARAPTICMQCLDSNPKSVTADAVGIADIVINCLDSNLHSLTNNITNMSKTEKGAVKTALEGCKKDLSDAITELSEAKKSLKTRDYDKAGHSVSIALGYPVRCMENLQNAKFSSLQLYKQINIYAQLSEAAMRIIDRF